MLAKTDDISLGRMLYISVNGEEAVPVRGVVLDMDEETGTHRIVLTNTEGETHDA